MICLKMKPTPILIGAVIFCCGVFVTLSQYHELLPFQSSEIMREQYTPTKRPKFAKCDMVYLDLGSNIGVQIRKLFEPLRYPGANIIKIFDRHFGTVRTNTSKICAIGIEMNPSHTTRLKALEYHYTTACGYNVHFFTETAATTYDGTIDYKTDNDKTNEEWGATVNVFEDNHTPITGRVKALDIARFITDELLPFASKIVVKIDIEGAEHNVLPRMMMTGALCGLDEIVIELHPRTFSELQKRIMALATNLYPDFIRVAGCKVNISYLDDETYLHDADRTMNTCS